MKSKTLTQLVGNTPLVEILKPAQKRGAKGRVLAKLEYFNPMGSVKDRIAVSMVEAAENQGLLKPGATIIEPTSGNTGIGLAGICTAKGYKLVLTMPESMSVERRNMLKALGAQVVLTEAAKGMPGSIARAQELRDGTPGSVILGQFDNPANPKAHYLTTGPEIWEQTGGKVDLFVAGVGTGGTLSGVGRRLKELNPDVRVVAVEPAASPVLSGGKAGPHAIQGIGAGFVPGNFDRRVVDRIVAVANEDALETARELARSEGYMTGISSGAALWAALQIACEEGSKGKNIVVILPDTGERYLSTVLYSG